MWLFCSSRSVRRTISSFSLRFSSQAKPSLRSCGSTVSSRLRRSAPTLRPHSANCRSEKHAIAQKKKPIPIASVLPERIAPSQMIAA